MPKQLTSTFAGLLLSSLLLGHADPTIAQAADAPNRGEQLYKTQCARCHGPQGEGTKKYKPRLEGERSPAQLADVIQKTMPESAPGSLSNADARAIADYIHGAFYSPLARERLRPARVELARLTVRQYRNAVADLVGSFRWKRTSAPAPQGLKGEYFKSRRFGPGERVLERTDPQVAFDFGTGPAVQGKMAAHEFSIRWAGSLLAPQTGLYEFVVRTEHAARLWVNEVKTPLIDAWVKSGKDTEYKATLFLVAGRHYHLRLEYSKAKQGVDDSKKAKGEPKPVKSSIALLWKPPGRVLEAIPPLYLTTAPAPEAFVCDTPFPPDDRSYGWERGTAVSKEWDQATTEAAFVTANYVASRANELSGVGDGAADRQAKLRQFAYTFAERAYRRPLSNQQKTAIDRQFAASKEDDVTALKRVVLLVLKSPWFLYREVGGGTSDAYAVASRLSFGLWDSIPDQELLTAAAGGKLGTRDEVSKQVERMLAAPRGRAKLREFLLTWLGADHGLDLAKESKLFPGFDAAAVSDLRTSLELFLDDVVWSDTSDFRQLLLSEELFLNGRLAKLYGGEAALEGNGFQKVKLDGDKRAGALTHPYLMASFAHDGESSPIHRGVFVARGLLGVSLKPPPEAVTPLAPSLHPKLTTRERVTLQTRATGCVTCHAVINSLGFPLEQFDAIGRFREKDNGKPVDATGSYQTREGKVAKFEGAREMAKFLAASPEAHAAFAEAMFHHLAQQAVRAYGPATLDRLRRSFAANGYHVRKLVAEVMVVTVLNEPRKTTPPAAADGPRR